MGYINKSYLQTQFSNFAARITAIFAKKTDIPTNMIGATASAAGKSGLAPAPSAGDNGKYLCGDGTWKEPTASVDTLTSMEQVEASTDLSKPVGAGAVQELNSSLASLEWQLIGQNLSSIDLTQWRSLKIGCISRGELSNTVDIELSVVNDIDLAYLESYISDTIYAKVNLSDGTCTKGSDTRSIFWGRK